MKKILILILCTNSLISAHALPHVSQEKKRTYTTHAWSCIKNAAKTTDTLLTKTGLGTIALVKITIGATILSRLVVHALWLGSDAIKSAGCIAIENAQCALHHQCTEDFAFTCGIPTPIITSSTLVTMGIGYLSYKYLLKNGIIQLNQLLN